MYVRGRSFRWTVLASVAFLVGACSSGGDPGFPSSGVAVPDDGSASTSTSSIPVLSPGATGMQDEPAVPSVGGPRGQSRGAPRPTGEATTATTNPGAPLTTVQHAGARCPAPKTCDKYAFLDGTARGWRDYDGDGLIEIEVWLFTQPPQGSSLSPAQVEAAIREAMAVWEEANPRVRFLTQGTTSEPPRQGDRITGRGPGQQEYKVTLAYGASVTHRRDFDNYISEADIFWTPTDPAASLAYNPCDRHRDDGCRNSNSSKLEIAHVLVHEFGHVLGLGDLGDSETRQLTMHTHPPPGGSRYAVTLGYGDRLGLDRLYPCNCPMPPTYEP